MAECHPGGAGLLNSTNPTAAHDTAPSSGVAEAGITEDELQALRTEQDHGFSETERAAIAYARELTRTADADERYVTGWPCKIRSCSRPNVTNAGIGEPVCRWHCVQKHRFVLAASPRTS